MLLAASSGQLTGLLAAQQRLCCPALRQRLQSTRPCQINLAQPLEAERPTTWHRHAAPRAQQGSTPHLKSIERARRHADSGKQQPTHAAGSDAVGIASGSGQLAVGHGSTQAAAPASGVGEEASTSSAQDQASGTTFRRTFRGHAGRLSFPGGLGRVSFYRRTPGAGSLVTKVVLSREMAELVAKAQLATQRQMRSWGSDSVELKRRLGELGSAGIVAYGLLNTVYYSLAFLGAWYLVVKVPAGLGMQAATRKFVEVMALVWAGSQVTKVPRAGGALALAPFVDRALDAATVRLQLRSKQDALILVVVGCVIVAAAVFGAVVVMHA